MFPRARSPATCPDVNNYGYIPVTVDAKAVEACQTPVKNVKAAIKACDDDKKCVGVIVGQNADGTFWGCLVPEEGLGAALGPGVPACLYLAAD